MRRTVSGLIVVIVVVSLLLGACAAPAPSPTPGTTGQPKEQWPSAIVLGGGESETSGMYMMSITVSEIITKYVPGVSASPKIWRGMEAVAQAVESKQLDIGHMGSTVSYSYYGRDYPLYAKIPGMRQLMLTTGAWWHTLATKNIKSYADLKGKRIMYDTPASSQAMETWYTIFKYYGFTKEDVITLPREGKAELAANLKAGTTDAGYQMATLPDAAFVEAFKSVPGLHLLAMDEGLMAAVLKLQFGQKPGSIPAGSYAGQDQDVPTLIGNNVYVLHKDMPEGLVYAITKAIHEHLDILYATHPMYKEINAKSSVRFLLHPIHPGAKRYYQEVGAWTPELEKKNQELLDIIAGWK